MQQATIEPLILTTIASGSQIYTDEYVILKAGAIHIKPSFI